MDNWNGFKGRAKRLDDIDLPKIGATVGVGEDEIHAVMDVEAAGSGFDSQGRPRILFERHWFYRLLAEHNPKQLQKAVNAGLAVKKWSRATYNQDQYGLLTKAMAIDEHLALMSASWGLGQVMGFNYAKTGYTGIYDFVTDMMDDEENHLAAMVAFIKNAGLAEKLRNHDWAGFARGYNGAGYRQNKYDEKLAAAYAKWSRIKDTPYDPEKDLADALSDALSDAIAEDAAKPTQKPQERDEAPNAGTGKEAAPKPSENKRGGPVNPILAAAVAIIAVVMVNAAGFFEWVLEMITWPWW